MTVMAVEKNGQHQQRPHKSVVILVLVFVLAFVGGAWWFSLSIPSSSSSSSLTSQSTKVEYYSSSAVQQSDFDLPTVRPVVRGGSHAYDGDKNKFPVDLIRDHLPYQSTSIYHSLNSSEKKSWDMQVSSRGVEVSPAKYLDNPRRIKRWALSSSSTNNLSFAVFFNIHYSSGDLSNTLNIVREQLESIYAGFARLQAISIMTNNDSEAIGIDWTVFYRTCGVFPFDDPLTWRSNRRWFRSKLRQQQDDDDDRMLFDKRSRLHPRPAWRRVAAGFKKQNNKKKNKKKNEDDFTAPCDKCHFLGHLDSGQESHTQHDMYNYCLKNPQHTVVYLHTKGSFRNHALNHQLRQFLMDGVTDPACLLMPQQQQGKEGGGCNVCGARFSPLPHFHFPGNMFVAKCSYISRLLPPENFDDRMGEAEQKLKSTGQWSPLLLDPAVMGVGRFASEHWVSSHPHVQPCEVYDGPYPWQYHVPARGEWRSNFSTAPRHRREFYLIKTYHATPSSIYGLKARLAEWRELYGSIAPAEWIRDYFNSNKNSSEEGEIEQPSWASVPRF